MVEKSSSYHFVMGRLWKFLLDKFVVVTTFSSLSRSSILFVLLCWMSWTCRPAVVLMFSCEDFSVILGWIMLSCEVFLYPLFLFINEVTRYSTLAGVYLVFGVCLEQRYWFSQKYWKQLSLMIRLWRCWRKEAYQVNPFVSHSISSGLNLGQKALHHKVGGNLILTSSCFSYK